MLKIALSGCCGRMGHVINDIVSGREGMEIVAGFDINTVQYADFPIFADPFEFTGECDVIIDFSNAASTERLLDYCEQHGTPVVICTTGHSAAPAGPHPCGFCKDRGVPFGQHVAWHQPDERTAQAVRRCSGRQVRRGDHREAPQPEAGMLLRARL